MPRVLSLSARQAINAQETSAVFLVLLSIDHQDLVGGPLRITSDSVQTVSGGNTYVPFPFSVILPSDRDGELASAKIVIDAVDRSIVAAVRSLTSAPKITLSVVLAQSPDTIELGPFEFELRDVSYNSSTIEGTLRFEPLLDEPFPADCYTPGLFPGLFLVSTLQPRPWAARYVGIPWRSNGRDRDGVDCYGLAVVIYRDLAGIELPPELTGVTDHATRHELQDLIRRRRDTGWRQVDRPIPLDLVLLRIAGVPCHLGVHAGNGWMLHALKGVDVAAQRLDRAPWSARVDSFWRWAGDHGH